MFLKYNKEEKNFDSFNILNEYAIYAIAVIS